MKKPIRKIIAPLLSLVTLAGTLAGTPAVANHLPDYQRVGGISGNLTTVGSDTLANLVSYWAESFRRHYPNINIQIQTSGSATAAPALTEATAQFGTMSRPMRAKEVDAFEQRYGYPPTAIKVGIDAMAIFVHQDNPLKGVSLSDVDALFSRTLFCGSRQPIDKWGEFGLTGSWVKRDVQLFGRNSVSGTYGYFKQRALCKGDFKDNVNEQPGSASVVQSVASSLNAVGYAGVGYHTAGVKALPVSETGDDYVTANVKNISNGHYPLSRYLYIYINKVPDEPLPPLVGEFVRLILSHEGQRLVEKEGFVPLSGSVIREQLQALGL